MTKVPHPGEPTLRDHERVARYGTAAPATTALATTAWVNCSAGVAGDMLLAGLIDAGADRVAVMSAWAALGLDGFAATWEHVDRAGVRALWTNLVIDQDDHGDDHVDVHDDDHHHHDHALVHGHPHRPARDVIALITSADLPPRVARDAARVYEALASVEAEIHRQDVSEVELHEVGALDSILDIVGVCAALDDLSIDLLSYSPVGLGAGITSTAHGELPHPAPATASLLAAAGAPVVGISTDLETATPTGVALLTVLGVATPAPPPMQVAAVGYGAGTANPAGRANIVQVLVGEAGAPWTAPPTTLPAATTGDAVPRPEESIGAYRDVPGDRLDEVQPEHLLLIETNIDDVTGEVIAYTIEELMADGALDAWATPILMKKGRPACTVHALCVPSHLGVIRDRLLSETGSLGARVHLVERWATSRRIDDVVIDGHTIGRKIVPATGRVKVEYADAARAARALNRPLRDVLAEAAYLS